MRDATNAGQHLLDQHGGVIVQHPDGPPLQCCINCNYYGSAAGLTHMTRQWKWSDRLGAYVEPECVEGCCGQGGIGCVACVEGIVGAIRAGAEVDGAHRPSNQLRFRAYKHFWNQACIEGGLTAPARACTRETEADQVGGRANLGNCIRVRIRTLYPSLDQNCTGYEPPPPQQ